MTYVLAPICYQCKRFQGGHPGTWGLFCEAYPGGDVGPDKQDRAGIPAAILETRVDHHEPYEGDHGLHFVAKSEEDAAEAAERVAQLPDKPAGTPIALDAEPHNRDWLRTLRQRRGIPEEP